MKLTEMYAARRAERMRNHNCEKDDPEFDLKQVEDQKPKEEDDEDDLDASEL